MDRPSNTFLPWQKSFNEDYNPLESYRQRSSNSQDKILNIERAKRAALTQQAEKLCASQEAHRNNVLKRLRQSSQQLTQPPPWSPASPRQGPESSLQGWRFRSVLNESFLNPDIQTWDDEDPFFEMKLHLANKITKLSYKLDRSYVTHRSPSPEASVAMSQLESSVLSPLTPTATQSLTKRKYHLPVNIGGAGNTAANGCMLQSASTNTEELMERLNPHQPPTAPKRTNPIPKPPTKAAPTNRSGPRHGTKLVLPKTDRVVEDNLKPLVNPSESLSLCLEQLESEDWEKKMEGFKLVQALARQHVEILQIKLHKVCLLLAEEVSNQRSTVACDAMDTIAQLHVNLAKVMDPEAEWIGRALLLKLAQTSNTFIHQQANLALDALVEGCSPSRVVSALLNAGLSQRCAVVRGSTAQHLHKLADIMGEYQIMTAGKTFTERFLHAVSKMAVDPAPEVRQHGQQMLAELARHKAFTLLWDKVISDHDRRPLTKILKKMGQQMSDHTNISGQHWI